MIAVAQHDAISDAGEHAKEEARALIMKTKAQTLIHVRVTGTRGSAWKPSARQGASSDLNCCVAPLVIQPKETKIAMPSHAS